jgi:biopolymer transport protein ExbD
MATTFNRAPQADDAVPMVEMNTTPLIDVLLVLLIMLIITIPVQSHIVKLDLPASGPTREINRLRNEVVVTRAGALLWNGEQVGRTELATLLDRVAAQPSPPEVHLRPDPQARYESVDEVLAIARRAHVPTLGFVGNENYARF